MDQRMEGEYHSPSAQSDWRHAAPQPSIQPIDPFDPPPRGVTWAAWVVIVLLCGVTVAMNVLGVRASSSSSTPSTSGSKIDRIGITMMEMQAKYMVGASQVQSGSDVIYATAKDSLNVGTVDQRLRFVVLAAELQGADEAARVLDELSTNLAAAQANVNKPFALTAEQQEVLRILHLLYPLREQAEGDAAQVDNANSHIQAIESLSSDDVNLLVDELGWFGEMALAPQGGNLRARQDALEPATLMFWFLIGITIAIGIAGLLGFVGLIIVLILSFTGTVRSGLGTGGAHHGLYAELFAVWMALFMLFQVGAGALGTLMPNFSLPIVFVAFFASLLAMFWPVARGVPFGTVRRDLGLNFGRTPLVEPFVGIGGYLMALPILAVGVAVTFALMMIQKSFETPGPLFDPAGGPAHPIIGRLADGDWFMRLSILALGAIAAPIVEEIMFRGALYRHLREGSRRLGIVASIVFATLLNSFIFALIHPQGWVAIPALMSLAIAFSLAREWRGSIVPAMIMHGVSNFLVLTLFMAAISL